MTIEYWRRCYISIIFMRLCGNVDVSLVLNRSWVTDTMVLNMVIVSRVSSAYRHVQPSFAGFFLRAWRTELSESPPDIFNR